MNFVLISPVGADVDLMPKTRPDRMTGTSVSTPTPWRDVHWLQPHLARNPFFTDYNNDNTISFSQTNGEREFLP